MKFKKISNRTIIGILCIVLALGITFGVAPLVNRFSDLKTDVVRMAKTVERGHQITAEDIEIVRVGSYNLPDNAIRDGNAVVGKFAVSDLYANDYLFAEKITTESTSATDILNALDGTKVAISVAIGSFAAGLSNKLENGDIVSVIIYDKDTYTSYTPAELKYVRVITTTTDEGVDKDGETNGAKASTVTVLVTAEQAELLAQYNSVTSLHFTLVYRGDKAKADAFITAQDTYLASLPLVTEAAGDE